MIGRFRSWVADDGNRWLLAFLIVVAAGLVGGVITQERARQHAIENCEGVDRTRVEVNERQAAFATIIVTLRDHVHADLVVARSSGAAAAKYKRQLMALRGTRIKRLPDGIACEEDFPPAWPL